MEGNRDNAPCTYNFGTDTMVLQTTNSQDLNLEIFNSQELSELQELPRLKFLLGPQGTAFVLENNAVNFQQNQEQSEFINIEQISTMNAPLVTSSQNDCDFSFYESPSTGSLPALSDYDGRFNFDAQLGDGSSGKSWVYSEILKQLFIDMNKVFMMEFKWACSAEVDVNSLFIRATAVYPNTDDLISPVERCIIHSSEEDRQLIAHKDGQCFCASMKLVGHVVRTGAEDAIYCFNRSSKRHSILVPMSILTPAHSCLQIPFQFTCKTSCAQGMNRRPIRLVFTLETYPDFGVLGRKSLLVKICSCPKRDMERLERDYHMFEVPMDIKTITFSSNKKRKMHDSLQRRYKAGKVIQENTLAVSDPGSENAVRTVRLIKDKMITQTKYLQQLKAEVDKLKTKIETAEEECKSIIQMCEPYRLV